MAHAVRSRLTMFITVAMLTVCGDGANTQDEVQPTNDLPNPYQTIAPWGKLPQGRSWGALNAVAIDNDGESVWVADRCGANPDTPPGASAFQYDSCAGSSVPPVLKFDSAGNLLKSFGADMFIFPHKIYVDRDGNVWVADQRSANERELAKFPEEKGKGHIVVKFSPDGKVLLTIGKQGVAGDPPDALTQPTSMAIAPNGDVFISEGHNQSAQAPPETVSRISKFTPDGKFIKSFGKLGSGPGEFRGPHDIAMDAQGRLYVADSESNGVAPHPGWKRGIRIGSVKDGKVLYRIPDPLEMKGTSAAEGLAVDAKGNVYGGEVGPRQLAKHVKQ